MSIVETLTQIPRPNPTKGIFRWSGNDPRTPVARLQGKLWVGQNSIRSKLGQKNTVYMEKDSLSCLAT